MNQATRMQVATPIPNYLFHFDHIMNREKLPFPEELTLQTLSDDAFVDDNFDFAKMFPKPHVDEPSQQLSTPGYQPTDHDIICGRGRGNFHHEGNKVYLSLLRKTTKSYLVATKRVDKSAIISNVVALLKERGFRFLKQDEKNKRWYELSNTECYERTAHALRDLIRKQKDRSGKKGSSNASSSSSDSDSSVASEKSHKKPRRQSQEASLNHNPLPLPNQILQSLPTATAMHQPIANDADSFDEHIGQIPSEVMSPITDTLRTTSEFDIFFEVNGDDFDKMLLQLDTSDKQKPRDS